MIDHKWYDYGASADRDRYTYGYDRAGNRKYRENVGPSAKDELYAYDGMYQFKEFDRGDLNEGKTDLTGTRVREEDFDLDPTGNWAGYIQKTSGTTQLNQSRTHNVVSETTDITETVGTGIPGTRTDIDTLGKTQQIAGRPASPTIALTWTYLCSCQLAGRGFLGAVGRRSSRGTGRCSFLQSWIAA